MAEKTAQEIGIERQGKFELYLTGLAFTVLGLSVQTAKVGSFFFSDFTELAGWACLLVSGLSGLRRLEQTPEHYRVQDLRNEQREKFLRAEEIMLGQPHATLEVLGVGTRSMRQYATETAAAIATIDRKLADLDRDLKRLYKVQRATFVGGLILVAAARATPAIERIANALGFRLL